MVGTVLIRRRRTGFVAGSSRLAMLGWLSAGAALIAYIVFSAQSEPLDGIRIVPVLLASALAEEILFRDDLPDAIERMRAVTALIPTRRELIASLASQIVFAFVHIPALIGQRAPELWWSLPLSITGTFAFGCLMSAFRRAGAGIASRTLYHATANLIAVAFPLSLGFHFVRLLGVTLAVLGSIGALRNIRVRFPMMLTRAAWPPGLPSAPLHGRGKARPAGHR